MSEYLIGTSIGFCLFSIHYFFGDWIKSLFIKDSSIQSISEIVQLEIDEENQIEKENNQVQSSDGVKYKIKKRKVENIPYDYRKSIIFLYEYFYKIGMIKTELLVKDTYKGREDFDLNFSLPLYNKICNEFSNVFKDETYYYSMHFDSKFDLLHDQYKFIYKEIIKHESLFYLIFKYDVSFNFCNLYTGKSVGVEEYKNAFKKISASVKHNPQDKAIFESIKNEVQTYSDATLHKEKNDFVNSLVEKVIEKPKEIIVNGGDDTSKVVKFDPTDDIISKYINK